MKKWLILLMASFTLAGCSTTATAPESASTASSAISQSVENPETASVTVSVMEDGKEVEGGKITAEVESGTILMDLMKKEYDIEEKDGFITSINGHDQDEEAGKYWLYDVNGEMAQVGANDLKLEDGDVVEFNLSVLE